MTHHAVIELDDIEYAFPGRGNCLTGLNFHLHEGERIGLFGPTAQARPPCSTSSWD